MKIGFASCNHPGKHPSQPAWLKLKDESLDSLVLLGDNTYVEDRIWQLWFFKPALKLSDADFARWMYERYRQQWSVPEFHALLLSLERRGARVLGTVDDHDFLGNDLMVTPPLQAKARVARVLHRQFLQACNAPLRSAYPELPEMSGQADPGFSEGLGLACSVSNENLLLVVLDSRSYRESPGPVARALGETQLRWFESLLDGPHKQVLVFSSSPLSKGTRPFVQGSTLCQYPLEHERIVRKYRALKGKKIVHVGGDLHYNDFKGRDIHPEYLEVCSSGLGSGWIPFWPWLNGNHGFIDVLPQGIRLRTEGSNPSRNVRVDWLD
jgi:hypothetical protein